ncbi:uncharacterized protein NEMAJ01_1169 [Nematocida major]|uniref:uncharacterized protein n=1 Tax=Nematocida major TaxID=1912982 RepID=UPI002008516C|nr:uncharacterized protein NEMAJ01_1169 [Nematocida major]KAH9386273.1 hypothetical protein NEMAJ01_1169 [Nematocida major]
MPCWCACGLEKQSKVAPFNLPAPSSRASSVRTLQQRVPGISPNNKRMCEQWKEKKFTCTWKANPCLSLEPFAPSKPCQLCTRFLRQARTTPLFGIRIRRPLPVQTLALCANKDPFLAFLQAQTVLFLAPSALLPLSALPKAFPGLPLQHAGSQYALASRSQALHAFSWQNRASLCSSCS